MSFQSKLSELMEKSCVVLSKLSNDTGINYSVMHKWVHDNVQPDIQAVKIISNYFNVSVDYLLDIEPPDITELLRYYRKLTLAQKEKSFEYLENILERRE